MIRGNGIAYKENNWCKIFGHNWTPAFVKGRFKTVHAKFIGCYCSRCNKGHAELLLTVEKMTTDYATYNEDFFEK
jgi:hypothetical protein